MITKWSLSIVVLLVLLTGWCSASDILIIDRFSSGAGVDGIPTGWRPLHFPRIGRHTRYTLAHDSGETVVMAVSNQSASAIFKDISVDPKSYPLLTWRWKVDGILKRGDGRVKSGDDYAARLYVTFLSDTTDIGITERVKRRVAKRIYGIDPPGRALNYIWANRIEKGASIPNAYSSEARMIAVESGPSEAGKWISEEADIYRDYTRLFGEEPPRVTGIAIMTDTDNTGESATAYYDDILFRKR
ncbi:MAG: DUF3047 domain-containing protein [Thermodesulfobacteriota bacterium]